jgi:ABC-type siderophore export system fused ATPase/permease subunit
MSGQPIRILFQGHFLHAITAGAKESRQNRVGHFHDDKYFDLADRIIKLDYGKLADHPVEAVESKVLVSHN